MRGRVPTLIGLALSIAFGTTGCVSSGKYDEVLQERDRLDTANAQLETRVEQLEAANDGNLNERVKLLEELEDTRVQRDRLEEDRDALKARVATLLEAKRELDDVLGAREAELEAVTSEVRELQSTYQGLVDDLQAEVAKGSIEIEQLRSGVKVAVADEILFDSGSANLGGGGQDLLEKVAKNLRKLDYRVEVTGHTDSIPIAGSLANRYPTNWELAAARASRVVRIFVDSGVDGARLVASSRAEYDPVASNDDVEGRRLNRRIEIHLRPRESGPVLDEVVVPGVAGAEAGDPEAP